MLVVLVAKGGDFISRRLFPSFFKIAGKQRMRLDGTQKEL